MRPNYLYIIFVFIFAPSLLQASPPEEDREYTTLTHVVKPKETLYKISRMHGVSIAAIKSTNKLKDNTISAAARLIIKIPKENNEFQVHIVRVEETMEAISEKYLLPMDILSKYNQLDDNIVFPGQRIFIKIDKINTKYTYTGNEDEPLTDAEVGEQNNESFIPNESNNNTPTPSFDPVPLNADTKDQPTPIYVYNSGAAKATQLKDSIAGNGRGFSIEGYVDAYYGLLSDKNKTGELSDYAMSAPRHNQTGLNTVQLAAVYNDSGLRGNITLQYGDLANAAYPAEYKFLQQANMGFRVLGGLWLDAGFFKSPVSVEDFPNKNNYSCIYSYTRFYEPVLFSGAKLGWEAKNVKITGFVSDRHFSPGSIVNTRLSYGLMLKIYGGKHWLMGANGMFSQIGSGAVIKDRFYGNVFIATNRKHLDVLGYVNYGTLNNTNMMSGVLNIRYKINPHFSLFTRGEYFNDSSATISPVMANNEGLLQGFNGTALSGGFEFKARPNHYLRIEARNTQLGNTFKVYPDYFNKGTMTNQRWEFVVSMGVWFGR